MNLRPLFLISAPLLVLAAAGCSETPNETIENAPTAAAAATPTETGGFGPAPRLGGNVLQISPAHAQTVTQVSTRTTNLQQPQGVCAVVSFENLPESGQWFRMAIDGNEVTDKLYWVVSSRETPTGGKVCYAPPEGLKAGQHAAAVSVQDPRNPAAVTKQLVAWKFAVSE